MATILRRHFPPVKNSTTGSLDKPLTPHAVYAHIVQYYGKQIGLAGQRLGPHALRATAATHALDHEVDIAKVQEWLGQANICTTRVL